MKAFFEIFLCMHSALPAVVETNKLPSILSSAVALHTNVRPQRIYEQILITKANNLYAYWHFSSNNLLNPASKQTHGNMSRIDPCCRWTGKVPCKMLTPNYCGVVVQLRS